MNCCWWIILLLACRGNCGNSVWRNCGCGSRRNSCMSCDNTYDNRRYMNDSCMNDNRSYMNDNCGCMNDNRSYMNDNYSRMNEDCGCDNNTSSNDNPFSY